MVVYSDKKTNFISDINLSMSLIKKLLIILCIITALFYSFVSPIFGFKFIITSLVLYKVSALVEILFLTHQRPMDFKKAKEHTKETYPEISGLILALLLPINTPLYVSIIGIAFAIFISKMAFGGFTYNIFNIAITARVFIQASWSDLLNNKQVDGLLDFLLNALFKLDYFKADYFLLNNLNFDSFKVVYNNLSIIYALIVVIVFIYMVIKKLINPLPTLFSLLCLLVSLGIALNFNFALYYISSPLVLIIVLFALNDPVTMPTTTTGKVIAIAVFAAITTFMSLINNNVYGILYALLFMNMLVPLIDDKTSVIKKSKTIILAVVIVLSISFLVNRMLELESNQQSEVSYVEK